MSVREATYVELGASLHTYLPSAERAALPFLRLIIVPHIRYRASERRIS